MLLVATTWLSQRRGQDHVVVTTTLFWFPVLVGGGVGVGGLIAVAEADEASGVRALSEKPVGSLTVDAIRAGEIGVADLRIHPETLERQAVVAQRHGNPQLAENLRRAAELTRLPDDEVLAIYETLRPGRSTAAQLTELADSLAARDLPRCAALVAEAAEVYARRGLTA
jgi:propanediol dehydratase small subunit